MATEITQAASQDDTATTTGGPHGSYWLTSTAGEAAGAPLDSTRAVDVAVIGAGIVGATTALLLARDGADVLLVDAGPVGAGITSCSTAKVSALQSITYAQLAASHDAATAQAYAAFNVQGLEWMRRTVQAEGIACDWRDRAAVVYTTQEALAPEIAGEHHAARAAGLATTLDGEVDLPYDVAAAVRLEGQAEVHPRRYVLGLVDRFLAAGGRVAERTRVLTVDDEGDRGGPFLVRTERGDVRAQQVVLATHYPILDRSLFFARVHVTREYVVAARLEGHAPQGMFYAAESPSRSLRTTPLPDGGELLLVGGEGHATGRGATGDRFGTLERWMREHFRVGAETWRWSAQDPTAHDKLPFAGRMPMGGRGRMWVVTGLRKWGFANGTSAAHVVAEGVRGRPHDLAGLVDPRRLRPKAAAFSFARENASVGTRFVAGRLTSLRPKTADELAPGEGAICRVEGHKAAAYRDAEGVLHAVSPICTHMGCEVRFNADERSWDCPCHASRFDVDGEVLEGPATRPLAPLETEADVEGGRIAEPG